MNTRTHSLIRKIALALCIMVSFVGLRFWLGYEEARGRDSMTVSALYEPTNALERFYGERSAYPAQSSSLITGLTMLSYQALSDDAKSPCTSKNVCPHYAIEYVAEKEKKRIGYSKKITSSFANNAKGNADHKDYKIGQRIGDARMKFSGIQGPLFGRKTGGMMQFLN